MHKTNLFVAAALSIFFLGIFHIGNCQETSEKAIVNAQDDSGKTSSIIAPEKLDIYFEGAIPIARPDADGITPIVFDGVLTIKKNGKDIVAEGKAHNYAGNWASVAGSSNATFFAEPPTSQVQLVIPPTLAEEGAFASLRYTPPALWNIQDTNFLFIVKVEVPKTIVPKDLPDYLAPVPQSPSVKIKILESIARKSQIALPKGTHVFFGCEVVCPSNDSWIKVVNGCIVGNDGCQVYPTSGKTEPAAKEEAKAAQNPIPIGNCQETSEQVLANTRDDRGLTPLMNAAEQGQTVSKEQLEAIDTTVALCVRVFSFQPCPMSERIKGLLKKYETDGLVGTAMAGYGAAMHSNGISIDIGPEWGQPFSFKSTKLPVVMFKNGAIGILDKEVFVKDGTEAKIDDMTLVFKKGQWCLNR